MQTLDDRDREGPTVAAPNGERVSVRDVPWRWRDVLVGLAPIVATQVVWRLLITTPIGSILGRFWIPSTLLTLVWTIAYPLVVARRHGVSPTVPRARRLLVLPRGSYSSWRQRQSWC